jgi:hypothetical protein
LSRYRPETDFASRHNGDLLQGDIINLPSKVEIGWGYLETNEEPEGNIFCLRVKGEHVLLLQSTGQKREYRRIGKGHVPLKNGEALFRRNDEVGTYSPEVRLYLI